MEALSLLAQESKAIACYGADRTKQFENSVFHIPKSWVASAEAKIQDGDIIAITSKDEAGYTSHVGLAARDDKGVLRFLHASSIHRRVTYDNRLSRYLADKSDDFGIIVVRPREFSVPGEAAMEVTVTRSQPAGSL